MGERCERCDKPVATDNDWVTTPEGDGEHLCWGSAVCASVDWRARALAAETERDALRAIVEGRTTAPTDAETEAHAVGRGRWRCLVPDALVMCADALHGQAARMHRDAVDASGFGSVWWALDSRGRPCAWPDVEVPRG